MALTMFYNYSNRFPAMLLPTRRWETAVDDFSRIHLRLTLANICTKITHNMPT